jgi:hypothetical protein
LFASVAKEALKASEKKARFVSSLCKKVSNIFGKATKVLQVICFTLARQEGFE